MNASHWGLIGAAIVLSLPNQSFAQDDNDSVEEIVVTGSRLIRRDTTAPSPLITIDRQAIENSGQPTLEETLNKLPQVQPGFGRGSNNPGTGTAQIDLRGLGAGRTLVMLNGRRIAPAGIGSAVDVNSLPSILMDRVEVITGGATTVYGADAIAGVVNFITRQDFDGLGLEASYYTTEKGDSDIADVNLVWGHNFDNGNIVLYGGYLDREPTFQSQRSFSAQTVSDNWFTGTLEPGGSTTTPAGVISFPRVNWGSGPTRTVFDANGDPREFVSPDDLYDFGPINYLQIPLERSSAGLLFNYDFSDRAELYTELSYTRNQTIQSLAPAGTFGAFFAVSSDNPAYTPATQNFLATNGIPLGPNVVGVGISRRLSELGPRIGDSTREYTRLLAGLRGDISENWQYDFWVTHTIGEEKRLEINDGSYSRLQQALLVDPVTGACLDPSNGCEPANLFGAGNLTEAAINFFRVDPYVTAVDRDQTLVSAFVRGQPLELPAGKVSVAIGAEWRDDVGILTADEALFTGDTLGFSADSNVIGDETVSEIYAEAIIPVLSDMAAASYLGLEIGGRLSEYDKAGRLETWKIGADWEPVNGLRVRAMLQRSARAPNLGEAGQLPYEADGTAVFSDPRQDPCSASANPIATGVADICLAQGIPAAQLGIYEATVQSLTTFLNGGNSDLQPEIAETFTAGFVITAFENWTIAVDYFELDVEDTIGASDPLLVCFDSANTARATCDRIQRDPVTYDINYVDQTAANLGNLQTEGVDTQINYSTEVENWLAFGRGHADIDVSVSWTHAFTNTIQGDPASSKLECVGYFGFTCSFFGNDSVFPDDRVNVNIGWGTDDWHVHLAYRWIDGSDNSAPAAAPIFGFPPEVVTPAIPSIGSFSYVDFSINYDINEHLNLGLTISNLFDRGPAFMADNGAQANTDTEYYDVWGRAYTLRLKLNY